MIKVIRSEFYKRYRREFNTRLSGSQVKALEFLLDEYEKIGDSITIPQFAYMMATIKHETAATYRPISEYGNKSYFDKYDPILAKTTKHRDRAIRMGNTVEGDGYKYRGRGFVQLTWKNNYKEAGRICHQDMVKNPDLVMDPKHAFYIMYDGMINGIFTGVCLDDCVKQGSVPDYKKARRIINGNDKCDLIAMYAEKFESALLVSVEADYKEQKQEPTEVKMPESKVETASEAVLKQNKKSPLKSKTVLVGSTAFSVATGFSILSSLMPELEGLISPQVYQIAIAGLGVIGVFLRFKTSQPII